MLKATGERQPPRSNFIAISDRSRNEVEGLSYLETTFVGSEFSSGVMFDVRTKTDLSVHKIHLHSRIGLIETNYSVFTKVGTYQGKEEIRKKWYSLSHGNVISLGNGNRTSTKTFEPLLRIEANTTQAFFILLSEPLLISSMGSSEGSPFKSNSHLEIFEGVGVTRNPLGNLTERPLIFNGVIYYNINLFENEEVEQPTLNDSSWNHSLQSSSQPLFRERITNDPKLGDPSSDIHDATIMRKRHHSDSTSYSTEEFPDSSPASPTVSSPFFPYFPSISTEASSLSSIPTMVDEHWESLTRIPYQFEIMYLPFRDIDGILAQADTLIYNSLTSILQEKFDENNRTEVISFKSSLITTPEIEELYCQTVERGKTCVSVIAVLKVGHEESIPSEDLQTLFLAYAEEIHGIFDSVASSSMEAKYNSSTFLMELQGRGVLVMNATETIIFENTTSQFLNDFFVENKVNLEITHVQVSNQKMTFNQSSPSITENYRHRSRNKEEIEGNELSRKLFSTNSTNFNLNMNLLIKGMYLPPPDLNFDESTWEAFEKGCSVFIESLNEANCFSGKIVNVKVYHDPQLFGRTVKKNKKIIFDRRFFYSSIVLFVFLFGGLLLYCCRKKKKKSVSSSLRNLKELVRAKSIRPNLRNIKELVHTSVRKSKAMHWWGKK